MAQYLKQVLIAFDQLVNALLNGMADETLSARAYRTAQDGKVFGLFWMPIIDALALMLTFGGDNNHCQDSYESERLRSQLPQAYSEK